MPSLQRFANTLTLADVYRARQIVYRTLRPTPLLQHPLLQARLASISTSSLLNHNRTTAFKIRGGLNLIGSLSDAARRGIVITASTDDRTHEGPLSADSPDGPSAQLNGTAPYQTLIKAPDSADWPNAQRR